MKTLIKIFSLIFLSSVVFYSCNDADLDVVDPAAGYSEGGLVRNDTKLANYVIGSGAAYTFEMLVYQGGIKTTKIDVMKTFTTAAVSAEDGTDSIPALSSNTALLKSFDMTSTDTDYYTFSTTYDELITGLEIDGEPLPESDSDLAIADYWTLTYVASTTEGKQHANGVTSKLAVATRLAGFYTVIDSDYNHPTLGPLGDFNGTERIIESVANNPEFATYLSTDVAYFVDDTNFFYFYVSNVAEADGTFKITIPKTYKGDVQLIWGSDDIATCQDGNLPDMPCTNYAKYNDDGHDEISMSYGYIRDTGTRQFYEIDIKD